MTEQQLQKKIIDYLQEKGYYVVKVVKANKAGVSDLLACVNGRFVSIEVKVGKNKPTPLQLHNLEEVKKAGGVSFVAYTLDDVKNFFENT